MRKEVIGACELYLGDCREVMERENLSLDVVITDPPYGIELGVGADKRSGTGRLSRTEQYASFADTVEHYDEVVVKTVSMCVGLAQRAAVFSTKNIARLPQPDAIGGVYIPSAVGRHSWGFASLVPIAFYGTAPDLQNGSRHTVLRSTELTEKNGHPCPKPLGWMTWLVDLASKPWETVLDPFMGSGTTGVACVRLGRRFVGIEIEPKYFDIACMRIETATKQPDLFVKEPGRSEQLPLLTDGV